MTRFLLDANLQLLIYCESEMVIDFPVGHKSLTHVLALRFDRLYRYSICLKVHLLHNEDATCN
jgi:hypothetical protein